MSQNAGTSTDPLADERRTQGRFVTLLTLALILTLILVGAAAIGTYRHPAPPIDCTRPIDYPLCERATQPAPAAPPSDTALFLGTIVTAVLAILLVWVGYHASVIEQKDLITAAAGSAPTSRTAERTPAPNLPPSAAVGQAPAKASAVTVIDDATRATPPAIRGNTITPDMIAPPKDSPTKGVTQADLKALPGGKGG